MYGLGDNIYQRPFVKKLCIRTERRFWLETPWPEIYSDIDNLFFVKPSTTLRTQNKNVNRQPNQLWVNAPNLLSVRIRYGSSEFMNGSIIDAMRKCFGVDPAPFDLPVFPSTKVDHPYIVVRPVTVRGEWRNEARNPAPEYIKEAVSILSKRGFKIVSVADLKANEEWAIEIPRHDIAFHHGELNIVDLLGLVRGASLVVGGIGWIVPACISMGVPLIAILGGQGAHNAPEKITCQSRMNLDKVKWIYPDNYCRCGNMLHRCDKTITRFSYKFEEAINQLCLAL